MSNLVPVEHWISVLEVISGGWTQGSNAKDSDDNPVDVAEPSATCFCLNGAMILVDWESEKGGLYSLMSEELVDFLSIYHKTTSGYVAWQDQKNRTYEQVLDLLAELIYQRTLRQEAA